MDMYRNMAKQYERFDFQLTISFMLDVFHEHMTAYDTELRL